MRRLSLALLLLLAAAPLAAQSSASSAETRTAQFVFVIDDSESMRETDPNRLAVFAAQSLLAMLDPRDEVSVVRLNGAAEREEPPPIQPLSRGREALFKLLGEKVAAYAGDNTTCRSALDSTRGLLEQAFRPNVAQVVLFLTDGVCTPEDEGKLDPGLFLRGLASHQDKLLQLYLLRFGDKEASPELRQLAGVTGGQVFDVPAGDPTALLHAFATALSRSQGYEAQLLSPSDPRINAYRGAKRVRLLAVASGKEPELRLSVHDRDGGSPRTLRTGQADTFQYRGGAEKDLKGRDDRPGQPFRFVAMDYRPDSGSRPDTSLTTVRVTGAGDGWKAVAVPEYRLSLKMAAREGSCESPGRPVADSGVGTGATVCLEADLVNESGVPVDAGLTGRELEAAVYIGATEPPVSMRLTGEKARFRLQLNNLEKGHLNLRPVVHLNLAGGKPAELRGRSLSFEVYSDQIVPSLNPPGFGTLHPGQEVRRELTLDGTFKPAPLRLSFRDRKDIPSCVTLELNGRPEGTPVTVGPGKGHSITLTVAPYCGPRSFKLPAELRRLLLEFEGRSPQDLSIPFALDYRLQAPDNVELKVRGGKHAEEALSLPGNRRKDLRLTATLTGTTPETWPERHLDLVLGGAPVGKPFTLRGDTLRLRAEASPCCAGGSYPASLELRPASLEGYAPGVEPPEPMVIPVRVEVESAGVWACWGYWIVRGLLLLLLLLAILYVLNMFRNSRWLKPVRVAEKLVPLTWTAHGGTAPIKDHKARVLELVQGALPWHRRILAWLKANPLAFGLPGRSYRETLELILQPHRDVARSAAVLIPRRGIQEAIGRDPVAFSGRLFAVAEGSVSFVCVPEKEGRIGRMSLDGAAPAQDLDPTRRSAVRLRGHKLLRHPEEWESHEEGRAAGWQVG